MAYQYRQILTSSAVVILIGLAATANPLLAHDGHHHDNKRQIQVIETKEPVDSYTERQSEMGEKSLSQPSTQEIPPGSESSTGTFTPLERTSISPNLQPGEFVFLLLVIGPMGLFSLKRWIHTS